jgi:hypothetical protein
MTSGLTVTALSGDLLPPAAVGLAVAVWPGRAGRRVRRLERMARARPGAVDPVDPVAQVSGQPSRAWRSFGERWGRAGKAQCAVRVPLAPDLLMELIACGLRAGLAVVDAVACAAEVAGDRPDPAADAVVPQSHRLIDRLAGRRAVPRPAAAAYLSQVVVRLRLGVAGHEAWARPPPELESLARALQLAELSGAPAAAVVARAATDARARARERTELAAARLGVRLVLPLGLAVLPGFVLLAVAPIVLGLAASVLRSGG